MTALRHADFDMFAHLTQASTIQGEPFVQG
jgi:hypothetical protein